MGKIRVGLITSVIDNRKGRGTALVARKYLEQIHRFTDTCGFTLIHAAKNDDPLYAHFPDMLMPKSPLPFATQMTSEILFWLKYRFTKKKFNIVHYLHPRVWPSYILSVGTRVAISIYDAGVMLDLYPTGIADRVFRFTNRFLHQRMHLIITCSEFSKREIVEHYRVRPERVHVVPLGIDPIFRPVLVTENIRGKLEVAYGIQQPYILSVSRFEPHKNILRLIEAYALFRKNGGTEKLVLVGGRHMARYSQEVESMICESGFSDSIHIAPFISEKDMPLLYSAAQMLVYPSLHEGFGLPIVEAFACGTPVVTSNTTACPETAGDAALICNPEDPDSIAEAMAKISANETVQKEMRSKGLARARQFSWEHNADEICRLYEKAAER